MQMSKRGRGAVDANRKDSPKAKWAEFYHLARRNQSKMQQSRKVLKARDRVFRYKKRLRSHDLQLGPDEENALVLVEENETTKTTPRLITKDRVKREETSIN